MVSTLFAGQYIDVRSLSKMESLRGQTCASLRCDLSMIRNVRSDSSSFVDKPSRLVADPYADRQQAISGLIPKVASGARIIVLRGADLGLPDGAEAPTSIMIPNLTSMR